MRELKRKVNILSGFYIDFERCCVCVNSESHEEIHLTQQEIKILRFLCLQSDNENEGYVTNEQIFEYLYGRPYRHDGSKPDLNNVTKAMSKVRAKKSKNGDIDIHQIIESDRNGSFRLKLIESPFQNETVSDTGTNKCINEKLAKDFISMVKDLILLTDEIKSSMANGTVLSPEIVAESIEIHKGLRIYSQIYSSTNPVLSKCIVSVGTSLSDFFLNLYNEEIDTNEVVEKWYDYLKNLDKLFSIL